jgi:hypothetical protein
MMRSLDLVLRVDSISTARRAPENSTNSAVIPGKDPEPPETHALAAIPARRATRLAGTTVYSAST